MSIGDRVRCFSRAMAQRGGAWSVVLVLSLRAADSAIVPFERDFTVRVWGKEHGLPDDRVLSLLQDHHGFIWVGTRRGVSRFDGRQFRTWSRSTHEAFVSEECTALAEDREGVIWVGTSDGLIRLGEGLSRFDPVSVAPTLPGVEGHQRAVQTLCAADTGELFVGTICGLICRRADGSWKRVHNVAAGLGLYNPGTASASTSDGAAWLGASTSGLFWRQQPKAPWIRSLTEPEHANTQLVRALATTRDGVLHAIVTYRDPPHWHWPGRLLRRHSTGWEPVLDSDLETRSCFPFLTPNSAGGLWFPKTNRVVGHWLNGALNQYAFPAKVAGQAFYCLTEDTEGNLWAGTMQDGLLCLLPRRIRILAVEDGLPDPKARALLEASDGTLWVGTDGGVVQMNGKERRVITQADGLASDMVRALAEDAQGRVWIGTRAGLSQWNGQSLDTVLYPGADHRTKVRALLRGSGFGFALMPGDHEPFSLAPALSAAPREGEGARFVRPRSEFGGGGAGRWFAGPGGALWIGTAQGLYRLGSDQTNAWLVANGLPHEDVCALHEDHQGQVWIGTDGGGLARVSANGFEKFDASKGLSSLRVYALHDDAEGALWAGTDRGLNMLRGHRLSVFTTAQGLPDNLVNGIVADTHGWLWIGHDRGIYRVQRRELIEVAEGTRSVAHCVAYAEEDGLLNPETNGQTSYPPSIRLRDGRVAFATMGGVALFDPKAPPDLTNAPSAHIEELRAGERVLFASRARGMGSSPSVSPKRQVSVEPADRGLLSIDFAVPAFRAPRRVRCWYRLVGLSANWTEAGALRQAAFARLGRGDYSFEVKAANHHGYASATPARLDFRVEPRWDERGSVRLAGTVLLLAVVAAIVRWRLLELRRFHRLERQAALARERARLAKDLHDGLGASLTEITLLSGLGDSRELSDEAIAARFDRLSRRTHEALHSLRDLIWTTNPAADSLEVLVSHLCRSVEAALEAAGLRCRLDFPAELPQVALGPETRKALLLAASEAVNNIIRHAQANQATLRLRLAAERLVLELEDDGRGFDAAETEQRGGTADRGLGLANMRERMIALGGQFDLQSRPGRGTKVTFSLPLPRETSS